MNPDEQISETTTVPQATHSETQSPARRATAAVENVVERGGDQLWAALRKRPYLGVAAAGGLAFAAATAFGVGEIAFGVFAAYATYRMLAKHDPPSKAFREAAKIDEELIV